MLKSQKHLSGSQVRARNHHSGPWKAKEMRCQDVASVVQVNCKATKMADRKNDWVKGGDAQSPVGITVRVIKGSPEGLESWW